MAKLELLTMSMREVDRLKTIQAVADGNLRAVTAAAKLNLSRRQVDRLTERYRLQGALGLLSRKRGQVHHCLEPEPAAVALAIIRERYPDFGPTLACENLREVHGIVLGKETMRKLMSDEDRHHVPEILPLPDRYRMH